jgi:hypothetical protein
LNCQLQRKQIDMRTFTVIAVLSVLGPLATAQRVALSGHAATMSAHATPVRQHLPANNFLLSRHASAFRRSSPYGPGYASLPFPFLGDNFDPGDIYSTGYPVSSEPPSYLMEALQQMASSGMNPLASAMNPTNSREPSSSEPLMIELQNGRYVHVKNAPMDGEAEPLTFAKNPQPAKVNRSEKSANVNQSPLLAAAPLTPAVLVFRDGHSEEVRDYTIANGTLYARGDYYTDGYWNKKIDLASVNVSETLQANAARNVKFVLPSSPNEVITRP